MNDKGVGVSGACGVLQGVPKASGVLYFGTSGTATRKQNGWTRILGGWTDIGMAGQKASIKDASGTQ